MILICLGLLYLAIAKKFEPLLLLPIGFGAILTNIPVAGIAESGGFLYLFYEVGVASTIFPSLSETFISNGESSFVYASRASMLIIPLWANVA